VSGPQQTPTTPFTPDEHRALTALRTRYDQDFDCFSQRERARLRFWRWLYRTGSLKIVQESAADQDRPQLPA